MERRNRSGMGGWRWAVFAALCFARPVEAMDPNRALSQYIRDRWSVEQGFPGGSVYAITETADGYLWIGGEKGLVRFDGLSFHLFNHMNSPALPAGPVLGLAASDDGDLWIRTQSPGILRYHDGIFQDVSRMFAPVQYPITAMFRQENGALLFTVLANITFKYSAGALTQRRFQAAPGDFLVISMAETGDGKLWLGTRATGLFSLSEGEVSAVPRGLHERKVNCLLPGGNKELWIGTDTGLVRWDGANIIEDGVPPSLSQVQVLSLSRDRESNIWVGTEGGLVRIDSKGVSSGERGGPPVAALFEDRDGNLWTGGTQGIERFRDSVFLSYAPSNVRRSQNSGPLYADEKDRTWFAPSDGGLFWLRGTQTEPARIAGLDRDSVYSMSGGAGELWLGRQRGGLTHLVETGGSFRARTYTREQGLAENSVYAVHQCRDGSVWAGTLKGGVSHFQNGRFTNYTSANGLASDSVSSIVEGPDGTMWFATPNGLSAFSNDRWKVYAGREGLPSGHVNSLLEDSSGVLWIGTSEGLAFLRSGRVQIPSPAPESLHEEVFGIAEDANGWLWITTSAHVLRVRRDKLLNGEPGEAREYGFRDGLLGTEGVKRDRSVIADPHGRIWFSMNRGISVVDPSRLTYSPVPATVHLQSISADGRPVDLARAVRIPASSQRIIFTYAGLSLSAPERIKYRYMLDSFDRAWSEPSAANEAGYSNLRPGSYRFRVMASNAESLWNGAEATIPVVIVPMFWQTWWFYVAAALACGLTIFAFYGYRLRRLTQQLNLRFEARLAERTRIAQELHDTLLQGFLSASMKLHVAVDRLPADSPAKPALGGVLEFMRRVTDEGRNTVQGLRSSYSGPPDLGQAFSTIPRELAIQADIQFRVIVEGQPRSLHPVLRDEVYRIGREALVNALRHSQATSIEVELEYAAKGLLMSVRDNGCGIDKQVVLSGREGHWGLPGMRERAERIGAQFHVWSSAAAGTEIELSVPSHVAFQSQSSNRLLRWFGRLFPRRARTQRLEPGAEDPHER